MRKNMSAKHRLAITCALEHFTAILAHQVLTNPELIKGMHPGFKEMWRWHAVEETEHKAVAFDVYQQASGSRSEERREGKSVDLGGRRIIKKTTYIERS